MKRVIKAIILSFVILVLAFGIYGVYGCLDYVKRCVKITPRDNIKAVETDKLYSIEEFFLIEREENKSNRRIDVRWEDGSRENIHVMGNGLFRVTGGTGYLCISLEDRNDYSHEGAYESVKLPVVSGTA